VQAVARRFMAAWAAVQRVGDNEKETAA